MVYFLPLTSTILEAEPIPPLRPMQHMPVPEPTAPSSKSSPVLRRASSTCSSVTCIPLISFSSPSLHSVTTQLTVPVETPAPVLVEEGEESDFEAAAATPAPARGDASAATGAGNEAAGEPQQADEGGESEAPAPPPYFTTPPDGERVQVVPSGETETVDRTQEVLGGQPATTPVPSKSGAPAAGDGAAETAGLPVALVALAVVAVVAVAALVIGMAVKPKRRRRR